MILKNSVYQNFPKLNIFLLSIFLCGYFNTGLADSKIVKGLWVVRNSITSKKNIDELMNMGAKCGLTDLFIQVRGRGELYYESKLEPKTPEILDKNFDPLAYILSHPLAKNFRIHAWLNVFFIWSADTLPRLHNHIINKRPDWLAYSKINGNMLMQYPKSAKIENSEGIYVSPLHPEVQQYFTKLVEDLVTQYNIDGIHLDYIRFPNTNFDLHPLVIKNFRRKYFVNPTEFLIDPEKFVQKFSLIGYELYINKWKKFLMNGLSDYIESFSTKMKSKKSQIILTAAVKPDVVQARWEYFQDWYTWIKNGWLDMVVPMNYAADTLIFHSRLSSYMNLMKNNQYIVGISLFNQSEKDVILKIKKTVELSKTGFVLFSYDQLKENRSIQTFLKKEF
jgi:uncharacterized lipoprotein YddW (UPF0748 family)